MITIHSLKKNVQCQLSGKKCAVGVEFSFDDGTFRTMVVSWAGLRQLAELKVGNDSTPQSQTATTAPNAKVERAANLVGDSEKSVRAS